MKKALSILCALVTATTMQISAFAADGTGETEFTAHVYSRYEITIPATVNADIETQVPVTISEAYIENGYKVTVSADNLSMDGLRLTNPNNQYAEYYVQFTNNDTNAIVNNESKTLVTFNTNEIVNNTATKYFGISSNPSTMPGQYTGTLEFSFECTEV